VVQASHRSESGPLIKVHVSQIHSPLEVEVEGKGFGVDLFGSFGSGFGSDLTSEVCRFGRRLLEDVDVEGSSSNIMTSGEGFRLRI